MTGMTLATIQEHSLRVFRLLNELEPRDCTTVDDELLDWQSAADWIHASCCVVSVSVEPDPDNSTMMCRPAWEYAAARAEIMKLTMKELVCFNFLWGAFESIVKIINPRGLRSLGVTRSCYEYLAGVPPLQSYEECLHELRLTLRSSGREKLANEFRLKPNMSIAGLGIYVVSRLRNSFAHGTSLLPMPSEWGENSDPKHFTSHPDIQLIAASSRILLFTIQMLLLVLHRNRAEVVDGVFDAEFESVDVNAALRCLHLKDVSDALDGGLFPVAKEI